MLLRRSKGGPGTTGRTRKWTAEPTPYVVDHLHECKASKEGSGSNFVPVYQHARLSRRLSQTGFTNTELCRNRETTQHRQKENLAAIRRFISTVTRAICEDSFRAAVLQDDIDIDKILNWLFEIARNLPHNLLSWNWIGLARINSPFTDECILNHHPHISPTWKLYLTKYLQATLCVLLAFSHQRCDTSKLVDGCVSHAFVNPTLARRYHRPLRP